ncbi:MAG: SDR family oxidoreductase [Deltaproteobacteria bacterium]|nr:SDR family oxidoreductase [Deltaproteobacteria bacterium]
MPTPSTTWLVTGFPSWIARAVVREIVEEEEGALVHLLAPEDRAKEAAEFCRGLRALGSVVRVLPGDAVRMDLGLPGRSYTALAGSVDLLVNAYDVSALPDDGTGGYGGLYGRLGDPVELTVRAAQEALEFASAAPRLRQLVQLGSLTVAGDFHGVWTEEDLTAGQRHRTAAERARHRAEHLLWRERSRVPFTIVRTGPVVGDSRTGEIGWYHGPHDLLEAILLQPPAAAWGRAAPEGLHLVPCDHLARVVRALGKAPPERSGVLHVAPAAPVPIERIREALRSVGAKAHVPRSLRGRLRKRYGAGASAVARTLSRVDTPAACSTRRALDVERAAGITSPRPVDYLPHLAAHAVARLAAEAQRLAEAGIEDSLDA